MIKKLKFTRIFKIFGPGLVTGAADDDPSGIATYSQSGAQFGLGQLWTILLMFPLMTAIQDSCARIGAVTGKGIAAVIRDRYNKSILYASVFLVVVANIINIGADIGAMAAALNLLIPINFAFLAFTFTLIILLLEVFTTYNSYAKILKILTISILAYPATAFIAGQNWNQVFNALIIPQISFDFSYLFLLVAVFGTTISPYMFFWEASEEVEEEILEKRLNKYGGIPRISKKYIRNLRIDNIIGMLFSEITAFFIIITAASVLNSQGVTNITSAQDAARAIEPLVSSFPNAGFIAKAIFAVGIIGLGLLAVPILAGSASYALCEVFKWKEGLSYKFKQAHGFYGSIILATFIGLLINFIGIDPIKALVYSAVFNGVAAVPLIFLIARIGSNKELMGEFRSGILVKSLVYITFFVMLFSAIFMFFTFF